MCMLKIVNFLIKCTVFNLYHCRTTDARCCVWITYYLFEGYSRKTGDVSLEPFGDDILKRGFQPVILLAFQIGTSKVVSSQ